MQELRCDVMRYVDPRHGLSVYVRIENTAIFSLQEYDL